MKVSIILPVINETFSLEETVSVIEKENEGTELEYIIVTAPRTTNESRAIIHTLMASPRTVIHHEQTLPFIGGALREAFERATGEYTILMASDLETDPHSVKDLIHTIQSEQVDIVTCSRWLTGVGFTGYNPLKLFLNKVFQILFGILYHTRLTDMTFAYRIFRTSILKEIEWEELKHPFLFETIIKPLRIGYHVREIPSPWSARREGVSQNTFLTNFLYFRIGLRVLFMSKNKICKQHYATQ